MLGVGRQRVRDGVCAGCWNSARYSPPWKLVCEAARRERTVIQTDRETRDLSRGSMVLLAHDDGFAVPKRQELPPVVLPQPIDSTVFLAKEYRPRPLAFLKPFGVHVPRLCTPRSDVPASTSVGGGGGHNRGVHIRGAAEEARLPFDSYATQGSNPPRAQACHSQVWASPWTDRDAHLGGLLRVFSRRRSRPQAPLAAPR